MRWHMPARHPVVSGKWRLAPVKARTIDPWMSLSPFVYMDGTAMRSKHSTLIWTCPLRHYYPRPSLAIIVIDIHAIVVAHSSILTLQLSLFLGYFYFATASLARACATHSSAITDTSNHATTRARKACNRPCWTRGFRFRTRSRHV